MSTIVIEMQSSAPFYTRTGWANVLKSVGFNVVEWWFEYESAFDLFNRIGDVSLFIGTTYNFNKSLDKIVRARPSMKVALFASAWGNLTDPIDTSKYPIVKVTQEEKDILGKLYRDVKKPNCVFIHITERQLEGCLGGWRTLGIPIMGLLLGADLFTYHPGIKPEQKYMCDLGYVGGKWGYKSITLDAFIGKYCDLNLNKRNIKIFGNGWDIPQHLGQLDFGEDAKLFASSKICPNVSEPHSYLFQDLIERIWKVPAAGGFLISDNVDLTETGLSGIVPQFSTYEEFVKIIDHFLNPDNENERLELLSRQRHVIFEGHTYYERMHKLLKMTGFAREAEDVLRRKKEVFGMNSIYGLKGVSS